MIPEISVEDLAQKLSSAEAFVILDVRELDELERAGLSDPHVQVCPMSRLARQGIGALPESVQPRDGTVYVLCHHGNRSAQVTSWMASRGWTNVFSVAGGIDEYARKIDPGVGKY